LSLADITHALIVLKFNADAAFLDYGGGSGLFTRLMRDRGFRFTHHDRYCPNLFSLGFALKTLPTDNDRFELITAFEVVEHLWEPFDQLKTLLSCSDTLLFTTELIREQPPSLHEWPYYASDEGQHITFLTTKALAILGKTLGAQVYSYQHLHLLTRVPFNRYLYRMLAHQKIAKSIATFCRRPSLIAEDYRSVSGRPLQQQHR
jgi:hypothetical protein